MYEIRPYEFHAKVARLTFADNRRRNVSYVSTIRYRLPRIGTARKIEGERRKKQHLLNLAFCFREQGKHVQDLSLMRGPLKRAAHRGPASIPGDVWRTTSFPDECEILYRQRLCTSSRPRSFISHPFPADRISAVNF